MAGLLALHSTEVRFCDILSATFPESGTKISTQTQMKILILEMEDQAPINPAKLVGLHVLGRWQLERQMYDFKTSLLPNFVYIHGEKYFCQECMNAGAS